MSKCDLESCQRDWWGKGRKERKSGCRQGCRREDKEERSWRRREGKCEGSELVCLNRMNISQTERGDVFPGNDFCTVHMPARYAESISSSRSPRNSTNYQSNFQRKSLLSQLWTIMYFYLRPETFSGNEQQPSEIVSNGLEKNSLPPKLRSNIRELCAVIMCVLKGIIVVFWLSFMMLLLLDPQNMPGLS